MALGSSFEKSFSHLHSSVRWSTGYLFSKVGPSHKWSHKLQKVPFFFVYTWETAINVWLVVGKNYCSQSSHLFGKVSNIRESSKRIQVKVTARNPALMVTAATSWLCVGLALAPPHTTCHMLLMPLFFNYSYTLLNKILSVRCCTFRRSYSNSLRTIFCCGVIHNLMN